MLPPETIELVTLAEGEFLLCSLPDFPRRRKTNANTPPTMSTAMIPMIA